MYELITPYDWITQIIGLTNDWISCMNGLHK
jgi:hypothetical protein